MGSGSESGTASPLPASVMQSGPVMRGPVPEPPQDITLQYQSMTPPPPPPAADTIESRAMASPKPVCIRSYYPHIFIEIYRIKFNNCLTIFLIIFLFTSF